MTPPIDDSPSMDLPGDPIAPNDKAPEKTETLKGGAEPARRRDQNEMLRDLRQQVIAGADVLPEGVIELRIEGEPEPLCIHVEEQIILGRFSAQAREAKEHVDLTAYFASGVSRRHAIIRRQGDTLALIDLESLNGTYLNGQSLTPGEPYPLSNGDKIALGDLVMNIRL